MPCSENASSASEMVRPRSRIHRVITPTTRPTGNHRVKVSSRNTRRAAAGERTSLTTASAAGRAVVDGQDMGPHQHPARVRVAGAGVAVAANDGLDLVPHRARLLGGHGDAVVAVAERVAPVGAATRAGPRPSARPARPAVDW